MVEVRLENVNKNFGKVVAVDNLNLNIESEEFLVLLGPSGCGKTTTLRLIAGLEKPDSGNIYIGDKLVNNLSPRDRNVAMVFQNYALYPYMKVFDNIAFPLRVRKTSKQQIDSKVHEIARLVGIEGLLERKPRQISGGQQQRVALARALVREPTLFLMDEPLSNLYAKLRVQMRTELKRLHHELKVTTIYVTHDQEEAMTLSDRIAIMNKGLLQQLGSPFDVYEKPVNLFVGGFIGSPAMNTVEGELVKKEGEYLASFSVCSLAIPTDVAVNIPSKELVLGIRPEHILIEEEKTRRSTAAKVEVVEPLGHEAILLLNVKGVLLTANTRLMKPLKVGEEIWISFAEDKLLLFEKQSANRIELAPEAPAAKEEAPVGMVACKYCEALMPETSATCPHCGTPRKKT
jgi:multiple sugar transport system ATP-binding protein